MPDVSSHSKPSTVYTVSRLNAEVKRLLLDHFEFIWVKGEISDLSQPGSGHMYFSLKDGTDQVRCAMFRTKNQKLDFDLQNGLQVLAQARPDLYEARGSFQLIINHMEPDGHGDLYKQFEQLKRKLEKEGLFASQRKRPIPSTPRRVGVITSGNGAALHDILTTLNKRFPAIEVFIYPTQVQGDHAPELICGAIGLANARHEVDLLILARGGGSFEDLRAFNEERVARAIAASDLPILTGIGHEVDFTIADLVADERAPTPTAAAQRASPDGNAIIRDTYALSKRLKNLLQRRIETGRQTLSVCHAHLLRFHPITRIETWAQRMDDIARRLFQTMQKHMDTSRRDYMLAGSAVIRQAPLERIHTARIHLQNDLHKLKFIAQRNLEHKHHRLDRLEERLKSLNPLSILKRGYSITTDAHGKIIRSATSLAIDQKINVRVEKGTVQALVKKLNPESGE